MQTNRAVVARPDNLRNEKFEHDVLPHQEIAHNGRRFKIVQLINSRALCNKAEIKNHCVKSYAHNCFHGHVFVRSLLEVHENDFEESLVNIEAGKCLGRINLYLM